MRSYDEAKRAIRKVYGDDPNFMTPVILGYEVINGYAVEFSTGVFMGDHLYGVSVVTLDGERTDLGQSFDSEIAARHYAADLSRR
jgi:hypothetical protein